MQHLFTSSVRTFTILAYFTLYLQWSGVLEGECGWHDHDDYWTWADEYFGDSIRCALPCDVSGGDCFFSFGDSCPELYVPVDDGAGNIAMTLTQLECRKGMNPDWGQTHFNNVLSAMLNAFVMITTEGWAEIMYALWHSWGLSVVVSIIFVLHMMFGAYFLLELALAVIFGEYSKAVEQDLARMEQVFGIIQSNTPRITWKSPELLTDVKIDAVDAEESDQVVPISEKTELNYEDMNFFSSMRRRAMRLYNTILFYIENLLYAIPASFTRPAASISASAKANRGILRYQMSSEDAEAAKMGCIMIGEGPNRVRRRLSSVLDTDAARKEIAAIAAEIQHERDIKVAKEAERATRKLVRRMIREHKRAASHNLLVPPAPEEPREGESQIPDIAMSTEKAIASALFTNNGGIAELDEKVDAIMEVANAELSGVDSATIRQSMKMATPLFSPEVVDLPPEDLDLNANSTGIAAGNNSESAKTSSTFASKSMRLISAPIRSIFSLRFFKSGKEPTPDDPLQGIELLPPNPNTRTVEMDTAITSIKFSLLAAQEKKLVAEMSAKLALDRPPPTGFFALKWHKFRNKFLAWYIKRIPSVPQRISAPLYKITRNHYWDFFFMLVIIANAILLGCEYHGMSADYAANLGLANLIFVILFSIEMILKILALGFRRYATNAFDVFDGLVVILSIVDIGLNGIQKEQSSSVGVLRGFRVVRIFKLMRSWTGLRRLMKALIIAIPAAGNAFLLLSIVVLVFAIMGMQLFGGKYRHAMNQGIIDEIPRLNFNHLWLSVITVFQVLDNENWDETLKVHMAIFGPQAAIFFLAAIIVGNFIFLNLFISILMGTIDEYDRRQVKDEEDAAEQRNEKAIENGGNHRDRFFDDDISSVDSAASSSFQTWGTVKFRPSGFLLRVTQYWGGLNSRLHDRIANRTRQLRQARRKVATCALCVGAEAVEGYDNHAGNHLDPNGIPFHKGNFDFPEEPSDPTNKMGGYPTKHVTILPTTILPYSQPGLDPSVSNTPHALQPRPLHHVYFNQDLPRTLHPHRNANGSNTSHVSSQHDSPLLGSPQSHLNQSNSQLNPAPHFTPLLDPINKSSTSLSPPDAHSRLYGNSFHAQDPTSDAMSSYSTSGSTILNPNQGIVNRSTVFSMADIAAAPNSHDSKTHEAFSGTRNASWSLRKSDSELRKPPLNPQTNVSESQMSLNDTLSLRNRSSDRFYPIDHPPRHPPSSSHSATSEAETHSHYDTAHFTGKPGVISQNKSSDSRATQSGSYRSPTKPPPISSPRINSNRSTSTPATMQGTVAAAINASLPRGDGRSSAQSTFAHLPPNFDFDIPEDLKGEKGRLSRVAMDTLEAISPHNNKAPTVNGGVTLHTKSDGTANKVLITLPATTLHRSVLRKEAGRARRRNEAPPEAVRVMVNKQGNIDVSFVGEVGAIIDLFEEPGSQEQVPLKKSYVEQIKTLVKKAGDTIKAPTKTVLRRSKSSPIRNIKSNRVAPFPSKNESSKSLPTSNSPKSLQSHDNRSPMNSNLSHLGFANPPILSITPLNPTPSMLMSASSQTPPSANDGVVSPVHTPPSQVPSNQAHTSITQTAQGALDSATGDPSKASHTPRPRSHQAEIQFMELTRRRNLTPKATPQSATPHPLSSRNRNSGWGPEPAMHPLSHASASQSSSASRLSGASNASAFLSARFSNNFVGHHLEPPLEEEEPLKSELNSASSSRVFNTASIRNTPPSNSLLQHSLNEHDPGNSASSSRSRSPYPHPQGSPRSILTNASRSQGRNTQDNEDARSVDSNATVPDDFFTKKSHFNFGFDDDLVPDGYVYDPKYDEEVTEFSLFCFSNRNPIRRFCLALVRNPWFEALALVLILMSSLNLALDEPRVEKCKILPETDPDQCIILGNYLFYSDVAIASFFAFEMLMRVIAKGLIMGRNSYLRSGWNVLDGAVVGVSIAALVANSARVRSFRALRAVRSLRALRMISRFPALRLVIDALVVALPRVKEPFIIIFIFSYIFAIIGLQNFRGGMFSCNDPDPAYQSAEMCVGAFYTTQEECGQQPTFALEKQCWETLDGLPMPRVWAPAPWNFDTIQNSLLVMFELITGENWPYIMTLGLDIQGVNVAGEPNSNPWAALFYIMAQIILNQFLIELFTGVIIDTYLDLRRNSQGLSLLTRQQKLWVDNIRVMLTIRPQRRMKPLESNIKWVRSLRHKLFVFVQSVFFDRLMMVCILLNMILMATTSSEESENWRKFHAYHNYFFTALFVVEAALLILGLGVKQYFYSWWHRYDFVIAIGAVISAIFGSGPIGTILRIFRIGRIVRLIRISPGVSRLLHTLLLSLPSLANVIGILMLDLFVFAVIGMNVFSGVKYGKLGFLSEDVNFDSFPVAFITMFRASTGENFNGIMRELSVAPPFCILSGPEANCGYPTAAAIFWVVFFTVTAFIMVNILVAIILEAFEESSDEATDSSTGLFRLTQAAATEYLRLWNKMDIEGQQFLDAESIVDIIIELPYPLGLLGDPRLKPLLQSFDDILAQDPMLPYVVTRKEFEYYEARKEKRKQEKREAKEAKKAAAAASSQKNGMETPKPSLFPIANGRFSLFSAVLPKKKVAIMPHTDATNSSNEEDEEEEVLDEEEEEVPPESPENHTLKRTGSFIKLRSRPIDPETGEEPSVLKYDVTNPKSEAFKQVAEEAALEPAGEAPLGDDAVEGAATVPRARRPTNSRWTKIQENLIPIIKQNKHIHRPYVSPEIVVARKKRGEKFKSNAVKNFVFAARKSTLLDLLRKEARAIFSKFPLVPNIQGKYHFHAVLHALMDRASGGAPLGAKLPSVQLTGAVRTKGLPVGVYTSLCAVQKRFRAHFHKRKLLMEKFREKWENSMMAYEDTLYPVPVDPFSPEASRDLDETLQASVEAASFSDSMTNRAKSSLELLQQEPVLRAVASSSALRTLRSVRSSAALNDAVDNNSLASPILSYRLSPGLPLQSIGYLPSLTPSSARNKDTPQPFFTMEDLTANSRRNLTFTQLSNPSIRDYRKSPTSPPSMLLESAQTSPYYSSAPATNTEQSTTSLPTLASVLDSMTMPRENLASTISAATEYSTELPGSNISGTVLRALQEPVNVTSKPATNVGTIDETLGKFATSAVSNLQETNMQPNDTVASPVPSEMKTEESVQTVDSNHSLS